MTRFVWATLSGLCLFWGGCAPDPVPIDLNFPSLRTFLFTETVEVQVFDLADGELGRCSELVAQLVNERAASGNPALRSNPLRACAVLDGDLKFEDVPPGAKAWVGLAKDANRTLLAGCTVAEAYADAPTITIDLFMTAEYRMAFRDETPIWRTTEEKCGAGAAP